VHDPHGPTSVSVTVEVKPGRPISITGAMLYKYQIPDDSRRTRLAPCSSANSL